MHTPGLAALRHVRVTPFQRKVLDVLINTYPRPMSARQLAARVYADDPNGGPEDSENCVSVYLFRIRKAIKPMGWTAGAAGNEQEGIRLRPLPNQAGQSL
jgi:hypothetical protein